MKSWTRRLAWPAMLALLVLAATAFAATPPVSVAKLTTITTSGLGTPGQIVQDSCGNLYELDSNDNLYELPAGSGGVAHQLVLSGTTEGGGLAIDSKNNLYMSSYQWDGKMLKIPSTNCVPQLSSATEFASPGSAESYWYFPAAMAVDAAGNVFAGTSGNQILENTAGGVLSVLYAASSEPYFIALDSKANLYFTYNSGGTIYELVNNAGSYSGTPTSIVTSLTNAAGMAFDNSGNLYVTDSSTHIVYEVPYSVNAAALVPANAFPVAAAPTANNFLSIAQDGKTLLFAQPQYQGTTLYELTPGSPNLGSVVIARSATANVNFSFNAAVNPATIAVLPAGGAFTNPGSGSCKAGTYAANSGCTVSVTFTPTEPGVAYGSVVLLDASGNQLAAAAISGTGSGAALTVDPGVVSIFASGFTAPSGAAIDNLGNLYFADAGQNAILKVAVGSTTPVALGSGLNAPTGVAVDGVGNVYVADSGNSQIVEIPVVNGVLSTAAQITLVSSSTSIAGSKLSKPAGIAVDSLGNLYIADGGNKRVVYLPYVGSWDLSLALSLGAGMSSPSAVAVDSSGNLYVADSGNGNVYELTAPLSGGVQVTAASGYNAPSALIVDPAGALFVVDQGNAKLWRIPVSSGALAPASAVNVIGQVSAAGTAIVKAPFGVAIDSIGNLYVSDSKNAAAYMVSRTSSTQSFGIWTPGATSGSLAYYLESAGNAPLTLANPFYTASGDTTQFSLLTTETGACANSASIAVGASCNLEATFAPLVNGNYSETLALSSNAANIAKPSLVFTGNGAVTAPTSTTLTQTSPTGSPSYDQAVTLSAVVTAAPSAGTPVGSVNLIVDGITKQTVSLSSGTATFTLAPGALTGGNHTLSAAYLGGSANFVDYSQSSSPSLNLTVKTVATTSVVTFTTLFNNPTSQPAGTSLKLTATVASTYAGVPTGAVAFAITDSGGTNLTQTAPLQPASGGAFQATYVYTPSAPASGVIYDVVSIVATYSGDINFAASVSAAGTIDVSPASGSIGVTTSGTALTSSATSQTAVTFTDTSYGGWQGVVSYQCAASTLPANAICVFSPGQVSVMANTASATYPAATTQMTVVVNNPPNSPAVSSMLWWVGGISGLVLLYARRRMMCGAWGAVSLLLGAILLSAAAIGMTACSSSLAFATPKGSSTVTVYAYTDPFNPSSLSTSTPTTMSCGTNSAGHGEPNLAPCSTNSFQIALTVQ